MMMIKNKKGRVENERNLFAHLDASLEAKNPRLLHVRAFHRLYTCSLAAVSARCQWLGNIRLNAYDMLCYTLPASRHKNHARLHYVAVCEAPHLAAMAHKKSTHSEKGGKISLRIVFNFISFIFFLHHH